MTDAQADALVAGLGTRDHWLSPIGSTTDPYRGPAPATPYSGTAYMSKHVGDTYDTSPYNPSDPPAESPYVPRESEAGITTSAWTGNMARLTAYAAVR
ncbi:hypothetical protein ACFWOY_02345 [Streptomyces sp. NPDC058423]|uniref:hypothetical protein n=1 Tax=unclassified Streptomyces TaxID=2593676 RepID=UPI00365F5BAE